MAAARPERSPYVRRRPRPPRGPRASDRRAWNGTDALVFGALLVALAVSASLLVHPWFDAADEAALEVELARSLVAGEGLSWLGAPVTGRAPGLALLIAPLLALRGADFLALNALVTALGAVALALAFVHLRPRVGAWLAVAVVLVLWLNPLFRRLSSQTLAHVPGLAALFACLVADRWARRRPGWGRELALGLALGAATLLHAAYALLAASVVVARLAEPGREGSWSALLGRRLLPLVLAFAAVVGPWALRDALVDGAPPADQLPAALAEREPASAGGLPDEARRRSGALVSLLGGRLVPGGGASGAPAAVSVVLAASLVVVLARRRTAGELFGVTMLALYATVLDADAGDLLPVLALGLGAAAEALSGILGVVAGERAGATVTAFALLVLVFLDADPRPRWPEIERRHRSRAAVAAEVAEHVPEEQRLAAPNGLALGVVLARPVASLVFAVRRRGDVRALRAVIDARSIDVLVLPRDDAEARALWPWVGREGRSRELERCVLVVPSAAEERRSARPVEVGR